MVITFELRVIEDKYAVIKTPLKTRITGDSSAEFKKWYESKNLTSYDAVIIDAANIAFIDSMGIASFISLYKKVVPDNKEFIVCSLSKELEALFKLLRLDRLFNIQYPGVDEAIKKIKAN